MFHLSAQYIGLLLVTVVLVMSALAIWDIRRSRRPLHRHDGQGLNEAQRRLIAKDLAVEPVFRPEDYNGDLRRARRSGHL